MTDEHNCRPTTPEIARQIHPDRRKNEAGYWALRDQLLNQYNGVWIGFADGVVMASGSSPVTVFHAAEASGQHPFLICVGKEEQPCRIRSCGHCSDSMWEDPIVKEVREIRERLAAEQGFDLKAIFADIYRRQESLGDRLVLPKKRAEPTAEADGDRNSGSHGSTSSEAASAT